MGVAVQTHVPDRVRELRACGYSPKQIAKTLDLRPAVAARLVRMLAAEEAGPHPSRRWSDAGSARGGAHT